MGFHLRLSSAKKSRITHWSGGCEKTIGVSEGGSWNMEGRPRRLLGGSPEELATVGGTRLLHEEDRSAIARTP